MYDNDENEPVYSREMIIEDMCWHRNTVYVLDEEGMINLWA
jgi:hypothetical protein